MYVDVHHNIRNPESFWKALETIEEQCGAARLRRVLRNETGDRAVALWEADSMDSAKAAIEALVGTFSENEYEPVKSLRAWRINHHEPRSQK